MNFRAWVRTVKFWFITALVLKCICAGISLKIGDPFWFGLVIPICVMVAYWLVGARVRDIYDIKLTVAKFADSVYYLGFLFTVGSIIICLVDIQSIGENLTGMAMRFGAALISTAIGMIARTLYVGFKPDQDDAVKSVEEQAIIASENLALMFDSTYQQLLVYRDNVLGASKEAITGVQEEIAELSKHSMVAMDAYFANATEKGNEAFDAMLKDARSASDNLLVTINGLSQKSEQTLERMEAHSLEFGKKAQERLEQTLFPDNLFAQKLKPSIDTLAGTTDGVNAGILTLADDVKTAARSVGTAIRSLNTKTQSLEETLTAVGGIVESQQRLMETITSQGSLVMERFERVQKEFLDTLDDYQQGHQEGVKANQEVISTLADKLGSLHEAVDGSMANLSTGVDEGFKSVNEVSAKSHDAIAINIRETLMPLIQAILDSNKVHGELAARVEQGSRNIEIAHGHLDELANKIDHINKIEISQLAVNEESIETQSVAHLNAVNELNKPDARPA
ncbi:formate dehydrogenase maturation protein FdhE [Pseudomonas corrugata]|uniref:hypothetical protein n=1 Tax=Pseudomonas corrugata TaxID=47879 RepID=UPI0028552313|nr:hypothetical protein [Pseudomonas corrugata]MDR7283165.1 formate dehydrogenase maturation protein FdhE [Pseudomonas corrugata]